MKLDVPRVVEISGRVAARIAALEREIWELAGEEFTIGSPQQLSEILFNKLGLSKKRRGKTGFSTDARVLQAIRGEHPIIEKIEDWRELSKLKSTYLDALPELIDARAPGASTRPSTRPRRRPGASRARTRTSRTCRSGPSSAARSGRASWPRRATS